MGVNTLSHLRNTLEILKSRGLREIKTAFDMDMLTNPNVRNGFLSLTELLDSMNFKSGTYVWDARYKGLDDYVWEQKISSIYSSDCRDKLQYQAMRELCVNMLNYGAAVQSYVSHDVENLVNKDLSETDKAVSGNAWDKWFAEAPTHHCALAVGHNASVLKTVGILMNILTVVL